jgi:ribonuclease E
MSKKMLISATMGESRVAIVENGILQDLHVDSAERGRIKGNIYKAQIVKIEPAIQACFIDYGASRHGFLTFSDIARSRLPQSQGSSKRSRIEDLLKPGMKLMVQCIKEPAGSKGAAFTTYISLPGRYLVLLPNAETSGGISRKIEDESERKKLRTLLSRIGRDKNYALIIRTVGLGRNKTDLERDLHYLDRFWQNIQQSYEETERPGLVFQEQNVVVRSIRDYYTTDMKEVLIDNADAFGAVEEYVRATMPRYVKRFQLYKGSTPLFAQFNLNQQIEQAYRKRVRLHSGGAIVIEQTEALVSIDVNSGKALQGRTMEETALTTNLEAAETIARQLRLRDLGGLIVIDFIDLRESRNQRKVESTLRQELRHDKARYTVGRISRFGLLEMSRQRIQGTIASTSHDRCPLCRGSGFVRSSSSSSFHVLSRLRELANDPNVGAIRASIPRSTALFILNEKRRELADLELSHNVKVEIVPTDSSPDELGSFTTMPGPKRNGASESPASNGSPSPAKSQDWTVEEFQVASEPIKKPAEENGTSSRQAANREDKRNKQERASSRDQGSSSKSSKESSSSQKDAGRQESEARSSDKTSAESNSAADKGQGRQEEKPAPAKAAAEEKTADSNRKTENTPRTKTRRRSSVRRTNATG